MKDRKNNGKLWQKLTLFILFYLNVFSFGRGIKGIFFFHLRYSRNVCCLS